MLAQQQHTTGPSRDIDIDDLLEDPELERLHAERLASMQKEAEKRAKMQQKGHGELQVSTQRHMLESDTKLTPSKDLCLVLWQGLQTFKDVKLP